MVPTRLPQFVEISRSDPDTRFLMQSAKDREVEESNDFVPEDEEPRNKLDNFGPQHQNVGIKLAPRICGRNAEAS